ncbi:hypothetical protein FRB96_006475 [Tulasnella sp. 330]|nr:hypothetical protein FRB96_006475 [Tulasnella sp. 330]
MTLFSSHNSVVGAPGPSFTAPENFHAIQAFTSSSAAQDTTPIRSPRKLFGGISAAAASMNTRNWRRRSSSLALDGTEGGSTREDGTTERSKTMNGSTSRRMRQSESSWSTSMTSEAGPSSSRHRKESGYGTDKDLPQIPPEQPLPVIPVIIPSQLLNKPTPITPTSEEQRLFGSGPSGSAPLVPAAVIITPSTPTATPRVSFGRNVSASVTSLSTTSMVSYAPPLRPLNGRMPLTSNDKPASAIRRVRSFTKDKSSEMAMRPHLALMNDPKGKGKEKELAWPTASSQEPGQEKLLTRKSSFWARTRGRVDSTPLLSNQDKLSVTLTPDSGVSEQATQSPVHRSASASSFHTRQRSKSFNNIAIHAPSLPSVRPTSPLLADFLKPLSPTRPTASLRKSAEKDLHEPPSLPNLGRGGASEPLDTTRSMSRTMSPKGSRMKLRHSQDSSLSAASSSRLSTRMTEFISPSSMADSVITSRLGTLSQDEQAEVTPWDMSEDLTVTISSIERPSRTASPEHRIPQENHPRSVTTSDLGELSPSVNTGSPKLALAMGSIANRRRSRSLFGLGGSSSRLTLPEASSNGSFQASGPSTPAALWSSSSERSTPTPTSAETPGADTTTPGVTVTRTPSASSSLSSSVVARQKFQRSTSTRSKTMLSSNQPPLLHRLSQNFFPGSPPTRVHGSGSASASSLTLSMQDFRHANGTASSRHSSPTVELSRKHSFGTSGAATPASSTSWVPLPTMPTPKPRLDDETPAAFLVRLMDVVSKADLASILASSSDDFYSRTLCCYMDRFDFTADPLDVALRKLLMDLSLPKETQQIDRVMEAFARRYENCNPGLFISKAFSLMMLHTDAFNRSNKRKMTKADYIKNTRLPGLAPEVLDCFYDNIVFAPFIFIEDPMESNGGRGNSTEALGAPILSAVAGLGGGAGTVSPASGVGGSSVFGQTKIDPYYLITRKLLVPLRADVETQIPQDNPYLYTGTAGAWDEQSLQLAFAHARPLQMSSQHVPNRRRGSLPLSTLISDGHPSDTTFNKASAATIKVIMIGILNRKEDVLEGGRKAPSRKWKEWGVLLTGSQLLFFRDSSVVTNAMTTRPRKDGPSKSTGELVSVPLSMPSSQPDEVVSLRDSIALYDTSYDKYPNAFRMALPNGRQFLMHAPSENAMNHWVSLINYACAFKSIGVRVRPVLMDRDQAKSTGTAAAMSHMNDMRRRRLVSMPGATPKIVLPCNKTPTGPIAEDGLHIHPDNSSDTSRTLYNSSNTLNGSTLSIGSIGNKRRLPTLGSASSLDLESPTAEPLDRRLEETFLEVKAELAAVTVGVGEGVKMQRSPSSTAGSGVRSVSLGNVPPDDWSRQRMSSEEFLPRGTRRDSRTLVLSSKLKELEGKIASAQSDLDVELRIACNLAVLTPFQASTRDRIVQTIPPLAKKIRVMRMDMAMFVCYRDVLYSDMIAEEREWNETIQVALRAGESFLKERAEATNGTLRSLHSPSPGISPRKSDEPMADGHLSPGLSSSWQVSSSSLRGSLCSLGSNSTDDAGNPSAKVTRKASVTSIDRNGEGTKSGNPAVTPPPPASPELKVDSDSSCSPSRQANPILSSKELDLSSPVQITPTSSPSSTMGNGKPSMPTIQEQCEDWDKTRAAKRVSLALLPSDRKLTALALLGRHSIRSPTEGILREGAEDVS